jgi:hypothetical protein
VTTVTAVKPWRNALRLDRRLPEGVCGPLLLAAFLRFAAICFSDAIELIYAVIPLSEYRRPRLLVALVRRLNQFYEIGFAAKVYWRL